MFKPKLLLPVILCNIFFTSFSQASLFEEYMRKGKSVFSEEFDRQDYSYAVENLEKAVEINPDDPEAHYFLGYAYSRLSSKHGSEINNMNLGLTLKASEQFELVNKLSPKYEGEYIILDPYSKLTGEWGTLSMNYWANNKPDSAIWACEEGKRRGGFGNYGLSVCRAMLDACTPNAIIITNGDNITLPLWYLKTVENYRDDVTAIDFNLLESKWYAAKIEELTNVGFGISPSLRDTMDYKVWPGLMVSISTPKDEEFSWFVPSGAYPGYMFRNERLFIHLLMENRFERDVYFSYGFDPKSKMGLADNLQPLILLERINYDNQQLPSGNAYRKIAESIVESVKYINKNSSEELYDADRMRMSIYGRIYGYLAEGKKEEARYLFALVEKGISQKSYPFQFENMKVYYDELKEELK